MTSALLPVAVNAPTEIGDGNHNGVLDRMVKFDRATVQSWFASDTVATFRVAGRLLGERGEFQGQTTARIIHAGVEHVDDANPGSVKH